MQQLNQELLNLMSDNEEMIQRLERFTSSPQVDNQETRMLKTQNQIMRDALGFYMQLEYNKGNYNSIAKNALIQVKLVA